MALNSVGSDSKKEFYKNLDTVMNALGKRETKKKTSEKQISDESVFQNNILQQIDRRLKEIEIIELNDTFSINTGFLITTDFDEMSEQEIVKEHEKIIMLESGLKNFLIIAQFARGKLYLSLAKKLQEAGQSLKKSIKSGLLRVSYTTVLRYITLATIISIYPRLIVCELSFSQILKHKTRLFKFLKSAEGQSLCAKLSLSITMRANENSIKINQMTMVMPDVKFSTDPDWAYHECYAEASVSDEKVQRWAQSATLVDEDGELEDFILHLEVK